MNIASNARGLESRANEPSNRHTAVVVLASLLVHKVIPESTDGFIVDPRTGICPRFDNDIFMVPLTGYGRCFTQVPSMTQILVWLRQAVHLLRREDIFIGGWGNSYDGLFWLDISVAVRGRSLAQSIGHACGQWSIYHPATNGVVHLRTQRAA